ncbi:peptidase M23 [Thermincola ferriacetica]|uniref:Peptidase M23 n=1 Tax=Thermincola ferriacetica TaxID=281456 RepID=A0A0L6W191_9FIRM|nr:peptidase M23 [Thermincola ferriacetica]
MKSITDKARSIFGSLAAKNGTFFSSLIKTDLKFTSLFKSSRKKLRLQKTKEYFSKHSQRKQHIMAPRQTVLAKKSPSVRFPFRSFLKEKISLFTAVKFLRKTCSNTLINIWSRINLGGSNGKWKKAVVVLTTVLCLAVITGVSVAYSTEKAVAVKVDGKQVALVSDKRAAQKVLEQLKKEKAHQWKQKLIIKEKVNFVDTEAKRYLIADIGALKPILDKKLTFVGVATGLKVNGKTVAILASRAEANKVLDTIKKRFTANINNMQTLSVGFREKVEISEIPASLADVVTVDQAVEKLMHGKEKARVHIVQSGDSLWTIARKYDTHVADLKAANPEIKGERLDLGQEIKLVKEEPLLTVVVEAKATVKETIPYNVKVIADKSMWKGRQKINQKGENGSREVTYKLVLANGTVENRTVLNQKVIKPAKDQIVVRGARLVVASRGGSGRLAWPTGGRITSPFGSRWGSMHTGLDIDGYTGQPVGAAEDGRVVSTGWDGAYGKQVTIDHGNGLRTKYAHLSKIEVSPGEYVSRGQLIGEVGSTGRSTGSHLHFEVMVGGSFRNPLPYLK